MSGGADRDNKDNKVLVEFWSKAFAPKEPEGAPDAEPAAEEDGEAWKKIAPSDKLFHAAASLGQRRRVLDYGCGGGWASIIAAKSGCVDVTAVDVAEGSAMAARANTKRFGVEQQVKVRHIDPDWLRTVPANTFDGFICSNVLDVVPADTAASILREAARVVTPDAEVIVSLNYWMSREKAAEKGMELTEDGRLYVDGVLRLVSRTDAEWEQLFAPYFRVKCLDYFAWPTEKSETRRLFRLGKG